MKILILALFLLSISSCNKSDPTPEVHDPIYTDLQTELDIAAKAAEAEEKNLEKLKKELDKAIPQTGQVKYATKKVRDSEERLNELSQQKTYFEIKIERRKYEVRQRYQESLKKGGRPWPDEKEIEMYKTVTAFYRDKLNWEKTKGVKKKDVPRGTKTAGESGHESGPAEGGGHEAAPAEGH